MLKQTMTAAVFAATLAGAGITSAYADEAPSWGAVTGSVAFTTNYNFRGFSQTQDDPAVQAGLTYSHPTGFYVGAWVSNIDFGNGPDGRAIGAKFETDLSGGFTKKFGNLSIDVGGVYYLYGGANDNNTATKVAVVPEVDYYEFYGKVGYDFGIASVLGSIYGSPNYSTKLGGSVYYNGTATIPLPFLPWNAALSGGAGYQTFIDDTKAGFAKDYWDFNVGLGFTIPWGGLGADFRFVDTSLPEASCGLATCKGTFIFTLSKSF